MVTNNVNYKVQLVLAGTLWNSRGDYQEFTE